MSETEQRDLRKQHQCFPHRPRDGIQGDCYPTALACVLQRPRDEIPHWHDDPGSDVINGRYKEWFATQNLRQIYFPVLPPEGGMSCHSAANDMWSRGSGLPMIMTGLGPRGVNHVIVVYGEDDYWCPTLGALDKTLFEGPALPSHYYWAEWIVRAPIINDGDSAT